MSLPFSVYEFLNLLFMIKVNVSHFVSDLYKDIAVLILVFNFKVLIWRDYGLEQSPRNVLKLSCLKESHNDIG